MYAIETTLQTQTRHFKNRYAKQQKQLPTNTAATKRKTWI